jgi:nucleotide-binding universal stress UspA family protein
MRRVPQAGWRIVVALEGTHQAQGALRYASSLARAVNGSVVLIRVGDPQADSGLYSVTASAGWPRQSAVVVDAQVIEGNNAASEIVAAANSCGADFIAMAADTSSDLERLLDKSSIDAIIRTARVPVLVVPPRWDRLISRSEPLRVVVPLDGSQSAEQALVPVLRLAGAIAVQLLLVRATRADTIDGRDAGEYLDHVRVQLEALLEGGRVDTRVVNAAPVDSILEAVLMFDADAIAMSTDGRTGLVRMAAGSVSRRILEQATVPLLLLGYHALSPPLAAQVHSHTPLRSPHTGMVGEVHRMVVT